MNPTSLTLIPKAFGDALPRLFAQTAFVVNGLGLTVHGVGSMQIDVAAGNGVVNAVPVAYAGGNVTPGNGAAIPVGQGRYDLIRFASGAVVPSVVAGVVALQPVPPVLAAGDLFLGIVFVSSGAVDYTTGSFLVDYTMPYVAPQLPAVPAIALGLAAAGGAAGTTIRSDATIAAFDAVAPVTQAFGDVAAVGVINFAARRDHKHGMPANPVTFAVPALTLGTANAAGAAGTVIRSDATILVFDATVPTTSAVGDAAAAGAAAVTARRDHVHGREAFSVVNPASVAAAAVLGVATTLSRSDHGHPHGSGYTADAHPYVTISGFTTIIQSGATSTWGSVATFFRDIGAANTPSTTMFVRTLLSAGGGTSITPLAGGYFTADVTGGTFSGTDHAIGLLGYLIAGAGSTVGAGFYGLEGRMDMNQDKAGTPQGWGTLGLAAFALNAPVNVQSLVGSEGRIEFNTGVTGNTNQVGVGGKFSVIPSGGALGTSFIWNALMGAATTNVRSAFRGLVQATQGDAELTVLDNATQRLRQLLVQAQSPLMGFAFKHGSSDLNSESTWQDSGGTFLARIRSDRALHLNSYATLPSLPTAGERSISVDSLTGWAWFTNSLGQQTTIDNVTQRRTQQVLVNPGATTITTYGIAAAPTLTATATNADDADGPWLNHATTAVSGNASGVISAAFTIWRRDWTPEYGTTVKTDAAAITTSRIWVGMFSASPDASATPAIHLAAFRYDTVADGTAFWRTVTDNGSGTPTVTTTTASIAANTAYTLRIRTTNNGGGHVMFYVNDVLVADHTAKLPTSTQLMGYGNRITTLANSIRNLKWGRIELFHA